MSNECSPLPPELDAALQRMIGRASDESGKEMACKVILREAEIWPQVARMLAEARADGGESKEFDILWDMIRTEIRATIRAASMRKTDDVIDDVQQQTAITVFRKRLDFKIDEGTFLVWARGIARTIAKWRRERPAPLPPPNGGGAVQPVRLPPSKCLEEMLHWVQQREPHQACVFLLHDYLTWSLEEIDSELAETLIPAIAMRVVEEVKSNVKGMADVERFFARLLMNSAAMPDVHLKDMYGNEVPKEALSHWRGSVSRWLRNRVFGGAKKLLTCVCELRAGAHERLTFLWTRFLRRTLASLAERADAMLKELFDEFRNEFPKISGLKQETVEDCTETLGKEFLPRTLRQSSAGNLGADLVVWRERVEKMAALKCLDGVVAYAYLCGVLPKMGRNVKGAVA